jgi:hypothetical protein
MQTGMRLFIGAAAIASVIAIAPQTNRAWSHGYGFWSQVVRIFSTQLL